MAETLKLMCVLAHPDDESMGVGGTLAKYAAEGVATYLITATRGQHGWQHDPHTYPGPTALGEQREAELHAAAAVLGIRDVTLLNYVDGQLDQAEPREVVAQIVAQIRRIRPHVVLTFGPDGAYGHPDHIAISQFASAAVVRAADPEYVVDDLAPHSVAKLYYVVANRDLIAAYTAVFGALRFPVDGVERGDMIWPDWAITTHIDAGDYWQTAWRAVACHRTQLPNYDLLERLPEELHRRLWANQRFYRTFSLVNGGREMEHDLFAGLR